MARAQLLSDTHDSLGHCGQDKLLSALRGSYWWPGMHVDVADCVRRCTVCQWDKPPAPPKEELCWTDKGGTPFVGWCIDMAGPFPRDEDGNRYLLVTVDPFSKWVEICAVPSLHSWRAAEFLYNDLVARWGKPRYVRTDNGAEFVGSFAWLCKGLGIVHHHITIGNSKANGQVKRTIRTLKDCTRRGLTKTPATFWTNHLAPALLLLRVTASRMMGVVPYLLATGRQPLLPSIAVPGLPALPDQPTPDEEQAYFADISRIVERLQELGSARIKEAEQRIRQLTKWGEGAKVNPTALFHFQPG